MSKVHIPAAQYEVFDKRLRSTQDKLLAALQQCYVAGEPFDTISIKALCQTAKVARQTYYRHYEGTEEIIEVAFARLINQFLEQADQTIRSDEEAAALAVNLFLKHRSLLAMVRWANIENQVIAYLSQDIQRVVGIEGSDAAEQGFKRDLLAHMYISFGEVMVDHPQLTRDELTTIYLQMIPVATEIFHTR